jgi:hypothetical protein
MPIAKTLIILGVSRWVVSKASRFFGSHTNKEKRFSELPHPTIPALSPSFLLEN